MKNHYRTLGVNSNATNAEIYKAYQRLAFMFDPDFNKLKGAAGKLIEVREAYETLIDKNTRAAHDKYLSANRPEPKQLKSCVLLIRDSNIPYAEGVKYTVVEPYANNNNNPKNGSSSIWGFVVWMLICAAASYVNHR
jgi:curved DNA-binding protein CbpA